MVLADPNAPRLEVARQLGASEAVQVGRDGKGQQQGGQSGIGHGGGAVSGKMAYKATKPRHGGDAFLVM